MVDPGKLAGRYNLVVADAYDLFDHRVPVHEFESMLRDRDVPDELCVVGIGETFENDDEVRELRRLMDDAADSLESRGSLPTIQFAVEGSFQRRSRDFELRTGGELYRLSRAFGPQIKRRDSDWLTAPF
jgi:hypothetical protein